MKKENLKQGSVLVVKALNFGYFKQQPILRGVDFSVNNGDKFLLLGAVGSGKSTLLNIISGLEKGAIGVIDLFGKRLGIIDNTAALDISYLPEMQVGLENKSLLDNINFAYDKLGKPQLTKSDALNLLKNFDINHDASVRFKKLSRLDKTRFEVLRASFKKGQLLLIDRSIRFYENAADTNGLEILFKRLIGGSCASIIACENFEDVDLFNGGDFKVLYLHIGKVYMFDSLEKMKSNPLDLHALDYYKDEFEKRVCTFSLKGEDWFINISKFASLDDLNACTREQKSKKSSKCCRERKAELIDDINQSVFDYVYKVPASCVLDKIDINTAQNAFFILAFDKELDALSSNQNFEYAIKNGKIFLFDALVFDRVI